MYRFCLSKKQAGEYFFRRNLKNKVEQHLPNSNTETYIKENIFDKKEEPNGKINKKCDNYTDGNDIRIKLKYISNSNNHNENNSENSNNKAFRKIFEIKLIRVFAVIIFAGILVLILFAHSEKNLKITFIDVDQGDCILIENPDGDTYMIDGGSSSVSNVGTQRIKNALYYKGISKIDYLIITHPDEDHTNGVLQLMSEDEAGSIKFENLLMPFFENNESYETLIETAKQSGINVVNLHAGMVIEDNTLSLTCLSPEKNEANSDTNDGSAVISLEYGDFDALFTGDISSEKESELLRKGAFNNKSDYEILKTAHHGSMGSTSEAFLEKLSFETAVISAGVDNTYGHPHKETLERLENAGTEILVTAECGEIEVVADKFGNYRRYCKLKY